ncbi:flagellar basal body-associated protein FliL [Jeotgalibacillus marinus]|uniref:Flagellar protein FliL n=1 Tax=Jeotgalibacillus marinus TaxID=86667 RepID=A0ABV3Q1V5_9BACL
MKNNLLLTMLIILVCITLVTVVVLYELNPLSKEEETGGPTIAEIVDASVEIPDVTSSIANNNFARLSMTIQTDSIKAGGELAQRDFQVKDIIIDELSEMTRTDLEGREGKNAFEEIVKDRVNELMQEGEVIKVYTTSIVIQ